MLACVRWNGKVVCRFSPRRGPTEDSQRVSDTKAHVSLRCQKFCNFQLETANELPGKLRHLLLH